MLKTMLAIILGSSMGGLLRWLLSTRFNTLITIPFGTLLSNLIAGYIIGFAMMFFSHNPNISSEWRLFIMNDNIRYHDLSLLKIKIAMSTIKCAH